MKRLLYPAIILLFLIAACKKNNDAAHNPVLSFANISDTLITASDTSQQIAIELNYFVSTKDIEGQKLSLDLDAVDVRDGTPAIVQVQLPIELNQYTVPENKTDIKGTMTVFLNGGAFALRPSRPGGDTALLRMVLTDQLTGRMSDTLSIRDIYILPQ